jgi:hypothetical protein
MNSSTARDKPPINGSLNQFVIRSIIQVCVWLRIVRLFR